MTQDEQIAASGLHPSGNYLTADQYCARVLQLLIKGAFADACKLYSQCQEDIGYILINRSSVNNQLLARVAQLLAQVRDFEKAALCCENLEQYAQAAQLYERCDDFYMAAEMYSKVGDFGRAATMYEKNGSHKDAAALYAKVKDWPRAAVCLQRTGDFFKAGKLYYSLKQYGKAIECLQQIGATDPDYLEATRMVAEVLTLSGSPELAIRKLLSVLQGRPAERDTLDMRYVLGILYRKLNRFQEAVDTFREVVAVEFNYKDAQARLKEAEEQLRRNPQAVPEPAAPVDSQAGAQDLSPLVQKQEEARLTRGGTKMPIRVSSTALVAAVGGFEHLRDLPLFSELTLEETRKFSAICNRLNIRGGETLIEQSTPGVALFVLASGKLEVKKITDGAERLLAALQPGSHVGEMSLVDDAPTSARVVAAEDSEVLEIKRDDFLNLLYSDDKIAHKVYRVLVKSLSARLRDTSAKLADMEKQRSPFPAAQG